MSYAAGKDGGRANDQADVEGDAASFVHVFDEDVSRSSRRRVRQMARRIVIITLPLAFVGACTISLRGRSALSPSSWGQELQRLWSIRTEGDDPDEANAAVAECVVDNSLAALYMARAGLEINGAINACEEVEELDVKTLEAYKEVLEALSEMQGAVSRATRIDAQLKKDANLLMHRARKVLDSTKKLGLDHIHLERLTEHSKEKLRREGFNLTARRLGALPEKPSAVGQPIKDMKDVYAQAKKLPKHGLDRLERKYGAAVVKQVDARFAMDGLSTGGPGAEKPGEKFMEGFKKVKERLESAHNERQDVENAAGAVEAGKPVGHRGPGQAEPTVKEALDDLKHAYAHLEFETNKHRAVDKECAAEIIGAITSFGYMAALWSAVVSECGQFYEQELYCSSDAARFVPSLTEMAAGAAAVSVQCSGDYIYLHTEDQFNRRLSEETVPAPSLQGMISGLRGNAGEASEHLEGDAEKELEEREEKEDKEREEIAEKGECAIDITQGTFMFARSGLEIHAATVHCNEGDPTRCAGSVTGVIAAVALGSMMVSNAINECPGGVDNMQAACAAAVLQLSSGTFELAATSAFFADSCMDDEETGLPASEVVPAGEAVPYGYPTGRKGHEDAVLLEGAA